jgi:hypothetical protein
MAVGQQIFSDPNRVSGKTLRVLMVEDSQKDAELVKRELTKVGLGWADGRHHGRTLELLAKPVAPE